MRLSIERPASKQEPRTDTALFLSGVSGLGLFLNIRCPVVAVAIALSGELFTGLA